MVSINLDIPKLFVKLPVETCGHYFYENKLTLFLDNIGEHIENRGVCVSRTDHPIKWHTHPKGHVWYPSAEDIILTCQTKSFSSDYIHSSSTSLIFTENGIWELFALRTFNLDETWNKYFLNVLGELITNFGKGRFPLQTFIQNMQKIINQPKLGNFFRCYLTPWKENYYQLRGNREMNTIPYLIRYEIYFVDKEDKETQKKLQGNPII